MIAHRMLVGFSVPGFALISLVGRPFGLQSLLLVSELAKRRLTNSRHDSGPCRNTSANRCGGRDHAITELLQTRIPAPDSLCSALENGPGRKRPMELTDLQKHQAADNEINWVTASFMIAFHVGAIVALFFFTWKAFFIAIVLWWMSASLGIGICY